KFNIYRNGPEGNALTKTTFRSLSLEKTIEELKSLIETKGYLLKDICVLVRSNSEAVAAVEALMDNGIDVISGEALLLNNNSAIKLILNTLHVMAGWSENTALYKANCLSLYAKIQHRTVSPEHYFDLKLKSLSALGNLLPPSLCANWQLWMQQPLPALLENMIEAYGLHEPQYAIHLPYLFAIRDLAGSFTQHGEKGIASFLSFWEEEGARKTLPSSEHADAVQVLTIHKSKGLAFKAVMLPFGNWDINGKANSIFWVPSTETPYHHLNSIPLKYNKDLGRSSVAKPYFEELLYNNMDALNMLYVATTRAKEYLYINSMGKKGDSVTNIGDLLYKVFEDRLTDESSYVLEETVPLQAEKESLRNELEIKGYPLSGRLGQVFDASLKRRDFDLVTGERAGRTGTILHDILAKAGAAAEVGKVLQDMLLEGVFKEEELPYLEAQAIAVLQHPGLQEILSQSRESLNEKSIIDAAGKSYRPDKVLVNGDTVTIVDYKFTQQESDAHIAQVSHYKSLLLAMGYREVKTYLFYAIAGQLKQV
ncbi:MAG: DNA helicase UvrD, partial [Pedobacter sp.]